VSTYLALVSTVVFVNNKSHSSQEISSASIYMALKFLEKESNGKNKLMNRALFEQILVENECLSE
jgi:hypothetical protein